LGSPQGEIEWSRFAAVMQQTLDFCTPCGSKAAWLKRSKSTGLPSRVPVDDWHELVGDATIGDAILDRLVHHAHRRLAPETSTPEVVLATTE
jgi:hypothetical protein